jgi:apolipoprotein D and lipocalin family protein
MQDETKGCHRMTDRMGRPRTGGARLRLLAGLALALSGLAACSSAGPPLPLASNVDLPRYAGHWFIIANIPYFAERGYVGSSFDVSFPGGEVLDIYTGFDKDFSAKPSRFTLHGYVVPDTGNARWRESPFWPLYFSYLILYVDPDYQTALVGYPGRGYGWVLSRAATMDEATYRGLLDRFGALGYDTTQFRRVPQSPDQIGQPGFQ